MEEIEKAKQKISEIKYYLKTAEARQDFDVLRRKCNQSIKALEKHIEFLEKQQTKLNEYKNIEEELEVEFLTIQKLRKVDDIYVNCSGHIRKLIYDNIRMDDEGVFINGDLDIEEKGYVEEDYIFEVKDEEYGTTWAFSKEELEVNKNGNNN